MPLFLARGQPDRLQDRRQLNKDTYSDGSCSPKNGYCTSCGRRSFQWCVRIHRSRESDTWGTNTRVNQDTEWALICSLGLGLHSHWTSWKLYRLHRLTWVLVRWSSSSRGCSCRPSGSLTACRRKKIHFNLILNLWFMIFFCTYCAVNCSLWVFHHYIWHIEQVWTQQFQPYASVWRQWQGKSSLITAAFMLHVA